MALGTFYLRAGATGGANNGSSYTNAWTTYAAVQWGAAAGAVGAGSTLYVVGTFTGQAEWQIGNHGGTALLPVTIRGDYTGEPANITYTSFFLSTSRANTIYDGLTITSAAGGFGMYGIASNSILRNCTFLGTAGIAFTNQQIADVTVQNNIFRVAGGAAGGQAIYSLRLAGNTSTHRRVTIKDNLFENINTVGLTQQRATVMFRVDGTAGSEIGYIQEDFRIEGNTFRNCLGLNLEVSGYVGLSSGLYVANNKFYDTIGMAGANGMGGAIAGAGWTLPSKTNGFPGAGDRNIIELNEGYRIQGRAGLINMGHGTYDIRDNYAEDITSIALQVDANGILVDRLCADTIVRRNKIKRVYGLTIVNTGCGLMVLDSTNIKFYGNIIDGCKWGIFIGDKIAGQSSVFSNNTFLDCQSGGVFIANNGSGAAADMNNNIIKNNVFTSTVSAPSFTIETASTFRAGNENYNNFYGCSAAVNHTLGANDMAADPLLDTSYKLTTGSPCIGAAIFTGYWSDFTGMKYRNPSSIGAYEYRLITPRAVRVP
jgi:hypothetical protein